MVDRWYGQLALGLLLTGFVWGACEGAVVSSHDPGDAAVADAAGDPCGPAPWRTASLSLGSEVLPSSSLHLAAGPNGTLLLVTWDEGLWGMAIALEDEQLQVVGDLRRVDRPGGTPSNQHSVLALDGGGFLVAWFEVRDAPVGDVYVRWLDALGRPVSEPQLVFEGPALWPERSSPVASDDTPMLAELEDGSLLVVWWRWARRLLPGGESLDPQALVVPTDLRLPRAHIADLAAGAAGGFLGLTEVSLAPPDEDPFPDPEVSYGTGLALRHYVFDATGVSMTNEVVIDHSFINSIRHDFVSVSSSPAAGIAAVAWMETSPVTAWMQRFDLSGEPLGDRTAVAELGFGSGGEYHYLDRAQVVMSSCGETAVSWYVPFWDNYGVRFSAGGPQPDQGLLDILPRLAPGPGPADFVVYGPVGDGDPTTPSEQIRVHLLFR